MRDGVIQPIEPTRLELHLLLDHGVLVTNDSPAEPFQHGRGENSARPIGCSEILPERSDRPFRRAGRAALHRRQSDINAEQLAASDLRNSNYHVASLPTKDA